MLENCKLTKQTAWNLKKCIAHLRKSIHGINEKLDLVMGIVQPKSSHHVPDQPMVVGQERMWDMSNCTYMASGDHRFLSIFFDLYFISITFERKFKAFKVFLDMSLVIRRLF